MIYRTSHSLAFSGTVDVFGDGRRLFLLFINELSGPGLIINEGKIIKVNKIDEIIKHSINYEIKKLFYNHFNEYCLWLRRKNRRQR